MSWCLSLVWAAALLVAEDGFAGKIRFDSGSIATGPSTKADAAALAVQASPDGATLLLVQFDGPIDEGTYTSLASSVTRVVSYVPENAYLVEASLPLAPSLEKSASVSWMGAMPSKLKISPRLARSYPSAGAGVAKPLQGRVGVTVLSVDPDAAEAVAQLGGTVVSAWQSLNGWYDVRASIDPEAIDDLAALWHVFRVEPLPQYQPLGERAAQTAAGNVLPGATTPFGPGYANWLAAKGLSGGPGIVVQVQDDGLDQGIATNAPGTAHPDLIGRIAGVFNATSDPAADSGAGHGQINASIIAGNASGGLVDAADFRLGQGLAPQARVFGTKIFRNDGVFEIGANTFADLAANAQDAGAVFSSNSWGADAEGAYTADSAEFDALTRDADASEVGDQAMIYFFSAGNEGPADRTLAAPATAKNVVAVGAGENSDQDGIDGCGTGPNEADNVRELAGFSSRGPTTDGRIGVDVFAVGTHVQGAASTSPNYTGNGICDAFWPPNGQQLYARSTGTSHACPAACGAGIVAYEFFETQLAPFGHSRNPSPALIRAVLTNTATDVAGESDGNGGTVQPVPSAQQGWGSVSLSGLVESPEALFSLDQEVAFEQTGQQWDVFLNPVDPTQPVRVTLAWSDAPALPGANPTLVNDLDLQVLSGTETYLGNVFAGGFSVSGGDPDRVNTLEAVYIENPTGPIHVTVRAQAIVANGVPGQGGVLDQDFALFATNASAQDDAGFVAIGASTLRCSGAIPVAVSDAGLQGAGTLNVTINSSLGDQEPLLRSEDNDEDGLFEGSITTSVGAVAPGDGFVQVADGETVTVTYIDANNGSGAQAVVTATAPVDCVGPAISKVRVEALSSTTAVIAFVTDEPALGSVRFGETCAGANIAMSGESATTLHRIAIGPLLPLTDYAFAVSAEDRAGNVRVDDNEGACFALRTLAEAGACASTVVVGGSFETGDFAGWEVATNGITTFGPWTVATLGSGFFGNGTPFAGERFAQNGFDGEEGLTYTLTQTVSIPADAVAAEFRWADRIQWDRANFSDDTGVSAREYEVTIEPANDPVLRETVFAFEVLPDTVGDTGWVEHSVDVFSLLPAIAGDDLLVRFHQVVPEASTGPAQFDLDGVCVRATRLPERAELVVSPRELSCTDVLSIAVAAGGLVEAESQSVLVSVGGGDTEFVDLSPVAGSPGSFAAMVPVVDADPVAADGVLQVRDGDVVTVFYEDSGDGMGEPGFLTETAVVDCTVPAVSNVQVTVLGPTAAVVQFSTNELADARVLFGEGCLLLFGEASNPTQRVDHVVMLENLDAGIPYRFAVEATDSAGNAVFDDNNGSCFAFRTPDAIESFTEAFGGDSGAFDLTLRSVVFTPDGSADFYDSCIETSSQLPIRRDSAIPIVGLTDDSFAEVAFTGAQTFAFYGQTYDRVFVGSNGYLTFGQGSANVVTTAAEHFALPRVAGYAADLDPSVQGTVSYEQRADRFVVTWERISQFFDFFDRNDNTFQIELFFDGTIRISHARIDSATGIVGLSEGLGVPENFVESDLSAANFDCQDLGRDDDPVGEGEGEGEGAALPEPDCTIQLTRDNVIPAPVPDPPIFQVGEARLFLDAGLIEVTHTVQSPTGILVYAGPPTESSIDAEPVIEFASVESGSIEPLTVDVGQAILGTGNVYVVITSLEYPNGQVRGDLVDACASLVDGFERFTIERLAQQILERFAEADADMSGSLSFDEAGAVVPSLKTDVLAGFDLDNSGELDPVELTISSASNPHSADRNGDGMLSLSEVTRVIQFFALRGYRCEGIAPSEDGYEAGPPLGNDPSDTQCLRHSSDYDPFDFDIRLNELLRTIQFFNAGGYRFCPENLTEDGYCSGPAS